MVRLAAVMVVGCVLSATAWAADRELALREGEKRAFKLQGVTQVAVDDASVLDVVSTAEGLNVGGKKVGTARLLVLLKNDQWVTFHVTVGGSAPDTGPVAESLPKEGEVLRLKVGERRVFDTPGITRLPLLGAVVYEVKVTGKQVELKGLSPGQGTFEVTLVDGQKLVRTVVVEGSPPRPTAVRPPPQPAEPVAAVAGAMLVVPVSGEVLLPTLGVEAVEVDDDDVAEVRIVSDSRVVVRGLSDGQTTVTIRAQGQVEKRLVTVEGPDTD